ncbi:uncharacterized protein LOC113393086 [Vanessa tameamea]|uniref:Uncharacterized protein LOC113393086 n=1 Tax=Vanessa tameamea TaxID=334116 RepID=A0A8B8HPU2_VANTA
MSDYTFMNRIRSFLGIRPEPPRNDFRNPIWGSDDDDDGDELYTRQQQIDVYSNPLELHREFVKHMHDMFNSFGSIFGDMKAFLGHDDLESFGTMTDFPSSENEPENFDSNRIRDYYLKPGYHDKYNYPKEDTDLDGKISSNEISGLLQQKEDGPIVPHTPFSGSLVPGRSFCQTIITTSVTKPDGTIETRRIVKKGNEVIEETTTSTEPDSRTPYNPGLNPIETTHLMLSQLSTFLRNFY